MPSGYINFPGVASAQELLATRTVGTRPDVAILWAQPQPGSPDCSGTATLSFSFNGVTMNWFNALCDKGTLTMSIHGHRQMFEIRDRRWRWSKAYVTAACNIREDDGSIDAATQLTLQQIAANIFYIMGEPTADVSRVSAVDYPEVMFDHDVASDAIDELLTTRGYVIALQADDSVAVYRRGQGATLPANGDVVNVGVTVNPPEIPLYLTALGKRTLVQSKLKFQPVGLEKNGQVVPVNSLSYMPAGGWAGTDFENFAWTNDATIQALCKKCIGKWYQVVSQADGTFNLNNGATNYCPGQITVTSAEQYLPLRGKLLGGQADQFGQIKGSDYFVEGTIYGGVLFANPDPGFNTPNFTRFDEELHPASLTEETGILKFDTLALKKSSGLGGGTFTFADIYVTCSYSVNDNISFVKDRFTYSQNLGGFGIDLYKMDELERQIIFAYAANSATVNGVTDNNSTLQTQADITLTQIANKYQTTTGNVLLYRGIYAFNTDGVNLQIRWDCAVQSPCPWGTYISQYFEGLSMLPTEREKSLQRHGRSAPDKTNRRVNQHKRTKRKLDQ